MFFKAPRLIEGFTKKASEELGKYVAPQNIEHYSIEVIEVKDNIAILKIHRFKICKGKSAKDYYAKVEVLSMWGNKIKSFCNYEVIQNFKDK